MKYHLLCSVMSYCRVDGSSAPLPLWYSSAVSDGVVGDDLSDPSPSPGVAATQDEPGTSYASASTVTCAPMESVTFYSSLRHED